MMDEIDSSIPMDINLSRNEFSVENQKRESPEKITIEDYEQPKRNLNQEEYKNSKEEFKVFDEEAQDLFDTYLLPTTKNQVKRRKKVLKQESPIQFINETFLQAFYPLSPCLTKNVTAGITKSLGYQPFVSLNQGVKKITFIEDAWRSCARYITLVQCYMTNQLHGKKTKIQLDDSDIEIEVVKTRGKFFVRFRNTSSHEDKLSLSLEEFEVFSHIAPTINRYLKQLNISGPMIKEYLLNTIENNENAPLVYGEVDSSIYNRLPHEVYLYKTMNSPRRITPDSVENSGEIISTSDVKPTV